MALPEPTSPEMFRAVRALLELTPNDRLAVISSLAPSDRERLGGQLHELLALVRYSAGEAL